MTAPYKEETFINTIWNFLPDITKILSAIAFVILFFTTLSLSLGTSTNQNYEYQNGLIRETNYSIGPKDSKVKFVYFFDLQCPACKGFHPTLNQLKAEYQDRVQFAYKNNPLDSIHVYAKDAAKGAGAAGKQGKYAEFVDLVYERQDQLGADTMETIVTELGMNLEQWKIDKKSPEIENNIEFDVEDLKKTYFPESSFTSVTKPTGEISGTPTIAILYNGEVIDWFSGGQSIDQVKAVLDAQLAK